MRRHNSLTTTPQEPWPRFSELDPGTVKSLACLYDPGTAPTHFTAVHTDPADLTKLLEAERLVSRVRAYVLFHALAYGVTPFTSGRSCTSVGPTHRACRTLPDEFGYRASNASSAYTLCRSPSLITICEAMQPPGISKVAQNSPNPESIILTAHTTKEEVRRWDARGKNQP